MKNEITIDKYLLKSSIISKFKYNISVFLNNQLEFQFNLSLQPTGDENELPTYQLFDKNEKLPLWVINNLSIISNWLKNC